MTMVTDDDLHALLAAIGAAEKGNKVLNRGVFLAVGGELRRERLSKQSSVEVEMPYAPGNPDPLIGVSFTQNANDILNLLADCHLPMALNSFRGGHGRMRYRAMVENSGITAATPALALSGALVAHILAARAGGVRLSRMLENWGGSAPPAVTRSPETNPD